MSERTFVFRRTDGTGNRLAVKCADVSAIGCDASVADVTATAQAVQIAL
jgi:hypothetical protein